MAGNSGLFETTPGAREQPDERALQEELDRMKAGLNLKYLELYINTHNLNVICRDSADGYTTLEFAPRPPELE